jgi:hypothetical protein
MDKLKWIWLIIIAAAAAASGYYHLLVLGRLEQTSALFIGIPALIAAICVLTPKPESATGTALKAVTIFLCISGLLLGEGFICILMAAPIFYLVAIVVGCATDHNRKRGHLYSCMVLVFVLPFTTEGTTPTLSFVRQEQVVQERVVAASPQQVEAALLSAPRLDSKLPFYLRLGFPRPVSATVSGARPGDKYVIHFAGGEGKPGDLTLEIKEHRPGLLSFHAISDTSHVAHWLKWEESRVEWEPVDASHTRVRWTLRYARLLDPAWYFKPWERYAVRLTAQQLIADAATPR